MTHQAHLPAYPSGLWRWRSSLQPWASSHASVHWAQGLSSASCWPLLHFPWPCLLFSQSPGPRHRGHKPTPALELVMSRAGPVGGGSTHSIQLVVGSKLVSCGIRQSPFEGRPTSAFHDTFRLQLYYPNEDVSQLSRSQGYQG